MEEEVFSSFLHSNSSVSFFSSATPFPNFLSQSFSLESSMRLFDTHTHTKQNGRRSFLKLSSLKFFNLYDSYISDSHIIGEFFLHFRLCLFVSFILWFFFFSSEWWFCFRVICVKSFELVVFNDFECDFICFGFCFIVWKSMVLKISITLSLKNRKPTETEIHRN